MRNDETADDDDEDQYRRVDAAFGQLKQAFGSAESLREQVERRIAAATMQPPRLMSPRAVVACSVAVIAAIVCAVAWFTIGKHPAPLETVMVPDPLALASQPEADFALEIGNAEVIQHLATTVDGGAVVVVWSYRGPGISVDDSTSTPQRVGKYRVLTRRGQPSTDGQTTVCSLFFPDAGVIPTLEPPGVRVRSGDDGRAIVFSAVPRTASPDELARATRAAGAADVEDVLRQAREQIR
jgi:hypothetical protein